MALRRATSRFAHDVRKLGERELATIKEALPGFESAGLGGPQGVRHASQLAVKTRMKSVKNIQKITKAMKMVAASKMRSAQVLTEQSRGIVEPLVRLLGDMPASEAEKNLTVPVSTDRGLCGGINTTISKYARSIISMNEADGKEASLAILGEKAKGQLQRDMKNNIAVTIADTTKVRITFSQVSQITEDLLKQDFGAARILYNRFVNAATFKPTIATILSPDTLEKNLEAGGKLDEYEIEGPDRSELLLDLCEFQMAATMYNAMCENACSEHASRMSAMENSTKNASEMLNDLTLQYNRSRQASITTELIEIISGASAISG